MKTVTRNAMIAAALVTLAACAPATGGTTGAGGGDGRLTVWTSFSGVQGEIIADYAAEFAAANPDAGVDLFEMATPDLKQKIQAAIVSGDLPDVIQYYGRSTMQPLVDSNSLVALDDFVAAAPEWQENLLPGWADNYTFDGRVYGVPVEAPLVHLFYNSEILANAGVAAPPATFDDLLAAITTLRSQGIIPVSVDGKDGWPVQEWYAYLVMRNGGATALDDALAGDLPWDDEVFVRSAEQLKQLVNAGIFQEGYLGEGYDAQLARYINGEAAMTLTGTWFLGNLTGADNGILEKTDYTVFPTVPGGSGATTEVQGGPNASFSVTSNADDATTAWRFVQGLTSEETATRVAVGANTLVPNTIEYDESTSPDIFDKLVASLDGYTGYTMFWNEVLTADANTEYTNLQNAMLVGDISPREMVDRFAAHMS